VAAVGPAVAGGTRAGPVIVIITGVVAVTSPVIVTGPIIVIVTGAVAGIR
jgi:hypothetical protein